MFLRVRLLLLMLGVMLAVVGCDANDSFELTAQGASSNLDQRLAVFGRVQTNELVEGATIVATDLTGRPLAGPVLTDATGGFWLRGTLPEDFRLVATLPGAGETLAAEVRGQDSAGRLLPINAVTNLVSLYLAQRPAATLLEAETAIRATLEIPSTVDLGFGLGESRYSPFSHTVFLNTASTAGGIDALSSSVVAAAIAGETRVFRKLGALRGQALFQDGGEADAAEELASGLLNAAGETLGVNIFTDATKGLYGWAAGACGWNFGTAGALDQIENQLDGLSDQVQSLSNQVSEDFQTLDNILALQSLVTTLRNKKDDLGTNDVGPIQTTLNGLVNLARATSPTNVPVPTNSLVTNLVATFNANSTTGQLNDLTNAQLGNLGEINVNANLMAVKMVQSGLATATLSGSNLYYDVRRNDILYTCLDQLSFYEGAQAAAGYLLAEIAHTQTNLSQAIIETAGTLTSLAATLQTQRQQLPDPLPSDDFYVDVEHGLVWYLVATPLWNTPSYPVSNPPFNYAFDILGFSELASRSFQIGDIPLEFTLATVDQMDILIGQAKSAYLNNGGASVSSGSKTMEVLPGLAELGFKGLPDVNALTTDGDQGTWGNRGFFLPLMPTDPDTPSYLPSGVKDPAGSSRSLPAGQYLTPVFYFSGDNHYHYSEASSVYQAGYEGLVPTVLPGNDPGFAILVAPLAFNEIYSGLPYSAPNQNSQPAVKAFTNPTTTDSTLAAPLLRSISAPLSLSSQVSGNTIKILGEYRVATGLTGNVTYQGVDLTDRVAFTSDNDSRVSVSNFPGGTLNGQTLPATNGQVSWHTNDTSLTGQITARLIVGYTGVAAGTSPPGHQTLTVQIPYGGGAALLTNLTSPPTLQSIMVTPTNQLISTLNSGGFATLTLHATGVYSDNSVQDVTKSVTWSVFDANGPVNSNLASVNPPAVGQLNLSQSLGFSTLTVKASIGSVAGTATIGTSFP